jgi:hypothetical protein
MMAGYLSSQGIHVQRKRIRTTLSSVDPQSAAKRWGRTVNRRIYSVPTPNALWHMDAHLKLVRLVTHSAIIINKSLRD